MTATDLVLIVLVLAAMAAVAVVDAQDRARTEGGAKA